MVQKQEGALGEEDVWKGLEAEDGFQRITFSPAFPILGPSSPSLKLLCNGKCILPAQQSLLLPEVLHLTPNAVF